MEHQAQLRHDHAARRPGRRATGEYYGLPWPCWGTPEMKHPGTPYPLRHLQHVKEGGGTFRARFGVERNGADLLAEGSWSKGSEIEDGYPEFTMAVLKQPGLGRRADARTRRRASSKQSAANIDRVELDDRPLRRHHPGGDEARLRRPTATPRRGRWPGTCPTRCRCTASRSTPPGRDLVAKYPTLDDRRGFRMPQLGKSVQAQRRGEGLPDHPDLRPAGRVRGRRRGDPVQPVAGRAAAGHVRRGQPDGRRARLASATAAVWVYGPESNSKVKVMALVTDRVGHGRRVHAVPFRRATGRARTSARNYPPGTDPIVLGESGQHRHDLWLRPRDLHAGNQGHALPDRAGVAEEREPWHE